MWTRQPTVSDLWHTQNYHHNAGIYAASLSIIIMSKGYEWCYIIMRLLVWQHAIFGSMLMFGSMCAEVHIVMCLWILGIIHCSSDYFIDLLVTFISRSNDYFIDHLRDYFNHYFTSSLDFPLTIAVTISFTIPVIILFTIPVMIASTNPVMIYCPFQWLFHLHFQWLLYWSFQWLFCFLFQWLFHILFQWLRYHSSDVLLGIHIIHD